MNFVQTVYISEEIGKNMQHTGSYKNLLVFRALQIFVAAKTRGSIVAAKTGNSIVAAKTRGIIVAAKEF